jgi:3-oxoacid CoA-transferase subunit A
MNKVLVSADDAVALIPDGATIMMGGFGLCGLPENLIKAIHTRGTKDLTLISNNAGVDDSARDSPLARQVRKMIATYVGENKEFERGKLNGDRGRARPGWTLPSVTVPAAGVGGFFTPTAYGTLVAEGKTRVIDGRHYVRDTTQADFAFVRAHRACDWNLVYRRTAQISTVMATAARVAIAEVEELVGRVRSIRSG